MNITFNISKPLHPLNSNDFLLKCRSTLLNAFKNCKKTRTKTEQFFKYVLIPAVAETFAQKRRTENKSLILHFHKNRSASMKLLLNNFNKM